MKQKSTRKFSQQLHHAYLVMGMVVLCFVTNFSIAQTTAGACPNSVKFESFESCSIGANGGTDLSKGLPRNGSHEIVKNVSQAGGGGYLNITPKTGNYFMLLHTSSNASDRLYYVNVNVVAGQTYSFCAFIANAKENPVNGFTITLNAGNTVIATGTALYGWNQLCGSYTATTTGIVQFSIKDPNPSYGPSHFMALDDIRISTTPTAKIGDFVWHDSNNNGVQDPGETGIGDVTVKLYNCADVLIATTTTAADGSYLFQNLAAGSYYVVFSAPSGFNFSSANQGGDITKDSDPDPVTGKTTCVTLAAGEINTSIDAGLYQKVSLGNFVWSDKNNNGIQDGGIEIGFTGLRVYLYKDANGDNVPDGPFIATALTQANGLYSFTSLDPGKYIVGLIIPVGYRPGASTASSANPDNDDNTDNNGVRVSGGQFYSNSITLTSNGEPTADGDDNNSNTTLDFGVACGCSHALGRGINPTGPVMQSSPIEEIAYKGFNVKGIYPNPFVDNLTISYSSEKAQKATVRITDNAGKTVYSTPASIVAGKNNIKLSALNHLAPGSYIVEVKTSNGVFIGKLIK